MHHFLKEYRHFQTINIFIKPSSQSNTNYYTNKATVC